MPGRLITRGQLGAVGQLFINGFAFSTLAGDLYRACARAAMADSALRINFGRTAFMWIGEAPPRESLPVAVLTHISADTLDEPAETAGRRTRVESRTFQVAVYSTDRDEAASLADQIAVALEAAARAGTLTHTRGTTVDVERDGVEVDELDPDPAPNGSDVWGHVVQLSAMVTRT